MTDIQALRIALERMAHAEGPSAVALLEREVLYGNTNPEIQRMVDRLTAIRKLGPLGALRVLAAIGRIL